MKKKTLTETITREELNSYSATVSYMDFGSGGSGSGSGFGGGGYKGGSSYGSAGNRTSFDTPSITERFNFKPDAMGPLRDPEFLSSMNKQRGIDSSFASAIKTSPSSFGSKYDPTSIDEIKMLLESSQKAMEAMKNVMGGMTPSSFGCGTPSNFGSNKEEYTITGNGNKTNTSFKIFSSEVDAPLTRLDLEGHHGMPIPHLQHLEKEFFGRGGNEAADIFADVFCKNTKIKFPWEK